mmetsp:Transcript_69930/g.123301  ORF Transcript_69930/g.123301 Transcript_69930/m.123301 type:complete len:80 (-) Transcript_69930:16-255(-)
MDVDLDLPMDVPDLEESDDEEEEGELDDLSDGEEQDEEAVIQGVVDAIAQLEDLRPEAAPGADEADPAIGPAALAHFRW